jgi:hypothetical protein
MRGEGGPHHLCQQWEGGKGGFDGLAEHDRRRDRQMEGNLLLPSHLGRIWWTLCSLKVGKKRSKEEGREPAGGAGYGNVFTGVGHRSKRSASVGDYFMQLFQCGRRWPTA